MYAQYVINTENPPNIEGIEWKIMKKKSVSQNFGIEQINEFTEKNSELLKSLSIKPILIGYESGGGRTNTGSSVIICGIDGQALNGFSLSRSANSNHALFISDKLVEIKTDYWNKSDFRFSTSITLYELKEDLIEKEELISFNYNYETLEHFLPSKYERFHIAIESSIRKTTCYHCRESHYLLF